MKQCIECGAEIRPGGFSWSKNTCWDCFELKVIHILEVLKSQNEESEELIYFLLCITALQFGEQIHAKKRRLRHCYDMLQRRFRYV